MKRVPQMELDTPLRPRAVAEAVWEEANLWLDEPLPRRWLRELIAEANTIYGNNPRFRRKLCSNGNTGRDWLWIFTRHWLAALIHERRPHLHARLPASYNTGHPCRQSPQFLRPTVIELSNSGHSMCDFPLQTVTPSPPPLIFTSDDRFSWGKISFATKCTRGLRDLM